MRQENLLKTGLASHLLLAAIVAITCFLSLRSAMALDGPTSVRRQELKHYGEFCRRVVMPDDYLTRFDINNDGLMDVITRPSSVTCDGVKAPECNLLGCPHRFYVQTTDGSFEKIAEIRFYSYSTYLRYGNQVFVFRMPGGVCGRATGATCDITYRVRDRRFVELKRE